MEAFGTDTEWFLGQPSRLWVNRFPADRATAVRIAAGVAELVLPEWRRGPPRRYRTSERSRPRCWTRVGVTMV